ncbi:BT_3928 family protein [Bernardetia sp.]|uniref:BT_3928 family protein n=1 Tax=Bernardetia sp. TaxID=1937974 RepID=UPI0025BE3EFD|nr:BT_3928 family protein [Bernardetia sp.]
MKFFNQVVCFIVGALFIFSGLVKAIDPKGTAIKLGEYFEVFATDLPSMSSFFHFLNQNALYLAIIFVVSEVVLGTALLVGFKRKITVWLLFLMITFFTFLTFYSAYFNKVTDCGCFGDFLPLEPWESFTKDVVLSVLIIILLVQVKKLTNKSSFFTFVTVSSITLLTGFLTFYAVYYEPPVDFRAYAIGKNIPKQMEAPEPAQYLYLMSKDGQQYEMDSYPTDPSYKYDSMILLNPKEIEPKITDYSLWDDEGDFTKESLTEKRIFILVQNVEKGNFNEFDKIKKMIDEVTSKDATIKVAILTSDTKQAIEMLKKNQNIDFPFYYIDGTVIKTIARSNPALWMLNEGTVVGKYSPNDIPSSVEVLELFK